ncbi:deoxynucleotidyltransferase terminal-interacting protein 2 isoform X2 [Anopheles moucheti]|uniref:deoxynucleotidyltransferase terminal-interacting protein 2 isoform X2 n=1 Tax=Anopheles moucheti TaxID=186751 RepID=UPI0022F05DEA|nr:deoxynucleotidyltransferase terminal-interacting protein 2 isoform X2 [Anopheles moucheti]
MDLFVIDLAGDSTANGGSNTASVARLPETFVSTFDGTTLCGEVGTAATKERDQDDYADDNDELDRMSWKGQHENREKSPAAAAQPSTSSRAKTMLRDFDLFRTDVVQHLKGAVLTPNIEKKEDIAHLALSNKALRKLNKLERKKTKGKNWFGIAAPQITPELQNELALMKMRSILDPKQSFKRLDKRKTPTYFEIGKVINSPLDHFNERGVKKIKSKSLVYELLADAEFHKYNKRKYAESLEKQKKKAYHKAVMKMKKEKKQSKKK